VRVYLVRHRFLVQSALDSACWALGLFVALLLRFDFSPSRTYVLGVLAFIPLASLAQFSAGVPFGLYTGRWRFGSFDEVAGLVPATAAATGILFTANVLISDPQLLPRSVPLAGGVFALVAMAGLRYMWRLALERRRRPRGEGAQRLLVFGAGEGAVQVVTALLRSPDSPYVPVALLDDDPVKRNLRIAGVPVLGGKGRLIAAAAESHAEAVLIAIPSADATLVTEVSDLAAGCGLPVKILPSVAELLGDTVDVGDIRDLTPSDLLGRHEIHIDLESIAEYIAGKRVLVTGAGGSIGSELCRQLYRYAPAELIMVDRDESGLHSVQLSIEGRALLESRDLILLDLRDREGVHELFVQRRPHVVFHAAALKHLPLLEQYPAEGVKTNIHATLDVLEAADATGVERFVNISTDKAADPCSVLGYSKRVAERLVAYWAEHSAMACLSVRFGNVLGSRGSVLTSFQAQIDRGGPITVTDPEVARYFMTVEEAVQLVIQAGGIGRPGEALVLDMGEPVRIAEVARLLSQRSPRPVNIEYTGLRPGEKLVEVRLGSGEVDSRPIHPLISHVEVPPLAGTFARQIDLQASTPELVGALERLCSTREPSRG
jgi:FlaA1/EpsC-like NDP-sugar epimerase